MPSGYNQLGHGHDELDRLDILFGDMPDLVKEWQQRNNELLRRISASQDAGDSAEAAKLQAELRARYKQYREGIPPILASRGAVADLELGADGEGTPRRVVDDMRKGLQTLREDVYTPPVSQEGDTFGSGARDARYRQVLGEFGLQMAVKGYSLLLRAQIAFALAPNIMELAGTYQQARWRNEFDRLPAQSGRPYRHNWEMGQGLVYGFTGTLGLPQPQADALCGYMDAGLAELPPELVPAGSQ